MAPHTLITGCSRGLGRALAVELAARGHHVTATARDLATLDDLPVARRLALDVTDAASVAAASAEVDHLDVLINNAGLTLWGPIELVEPADVHAAFDANVHGVIATIQAFAPRLRAQRHGTIVNVSSIGSWQTPPFHGIYTATKYALLALSEALRYELATFGVRVVCVEPGRISTNIQARGRTTRIVDEDYRLLIDEMPLPTPPPRPPMTPAAAAVEIADVLEHPSPGLRFQIGDEAIDRVARLATMTQRDRDEQYLSLLLGADWPGRVAASVA